MASPSPSPSPNPNPNSVPLDRHALFRPPMSSSSSPASSPSASPFLYPQQPFQLYPPAPHLQQPPPFFPPQSSFPYPQPFPFPQQPPPQAPYASPHPNPHGAHLMALLGTAPSAPPVPPSPEFPTLFAAPPSRISSAKAPRGRPLPLAEPLVTYDIDARPPGEPRPPQLEVTPITKYASDPGLVLGRQIAVNRTYICYGLKLGAIRVLNINTALRALLKGHGQRVSDMAFFAEDVHLLASASVDGKIFVWKIDEGPDETNKPQISEMVVVAVQISIDQETIHPRICWHCHKQEILVVGIGNTVLKIDIHKVRKGDSFSAENPLKFHIEKLIDGVELIGKHDADVTDLSMCQWMITRLVSASKDGTIKIWEDRKAEPLLTIKPHDGLPVNSVAFLTAPHRPEHIVLLTAGPLNREVKLWVSASHEGWLLPTDSESWYCSQTLDLRSSSEARNEEAFFNQVVVLPQASLILLANAKKNAIYAVHVDYGPTPVSTRMDYIAEFTVTMPILSLTATFECFPDGEQVVQLYCVQTHAIQQYALDLFQCLPPALESVALERDPLSSNNFEIPTSDVFAIPEPSRGGFEIEIPTTNASNLLPNASSSVAPTAGRNVSQDSSEINDLRELDNRNMEKHQPSFSKLDANNIHVPTHLVSVSPEVSGKLSTSVYSSTVADQVPSLDSQNSSEVFKVHAAENAEDALKNLSSFTSVAVSMVTEESCSRAEDTSLLQSFSISSMVNNVPHLITPSEILAGAIKSSEKADALLVKGHEESLVTGADSGLDKTEHDFNMLNESAKEFSITESGTLDIMVSESTSALVTEHAATKTVDENRVRSIDVQADESVEESPDTSEKSQLVIESMPNDVSEKVIDSREGPQSPHVRGKIQNVKRQQASDPSSSRMVPSESTDSFEYHMSGPVVPEAILSRFRTLEENMSQILAIQREMQKNFSATIAIPVTKEGKRIETSLGRSMEKTMKANSDALWARFQEENAKREKLERDQMQQLSGIVTNFMSKELPAMIEKALKKEYSSIGPALARGVTPVMEKIITTTITECFQRGIGDKLLAQLEKSINSKLEATVARQIQVQFNTSGKQAIQDVLRSTLESSVIPAFEQSCKSMFEQVDTAFQKGMFEYTSSIQKQFETSHTSLAVTLKDALSSASSITQNLSKELAEIQHKVLATLASGSQSSSNLNTMQQTNEPVRGLPLSGVPIDPKKELTRLVSENKLEEAFTLALQRSDVSIVSWLCCQVDLHGICSMTPSRLSQGVLLALLQQVACDLMKDTTKKLDWMRDVAAAIDPTDPTVALHARPIFEQIYQILHHQRSLPTTTSADGAGIRLLLHVIHSMLISCK